MWTLAAELGKHLHYFTGSVLKYSLRISEYYETVMSAVNVIVQW